MTLLKIFNLHVVFIVSLLLSSNTKTSFIADATRSIAQGWHGTPTLLKVGSFLGVAYLARQADWYYTILVQSQKGSSWDENFYAEKIDASFKLDAVIGVSCIVGTFLYDICSNNCTWHTRHSLLKWLIPLGIAYSVRQPLWYLLQTRNLKAIEELGDNVWHDKEWLAHSFKGDILNLGVVVAGCGLFHLVTKPLVK